MFTYTIDPTNFSVKIFVEGTLSPIMYQPSWPDGTPWLSEHSARIWAEATLLSLEDPNSPPAPTGPSSLEI
jgi:hypothetical protein